MIKIKKSLKVDVFWKNENKNTGKMKLTYYDNYHFEKDFYNHLMFCLKNSDSLLNIKIKYGN